MYLGWAVNDSFVFPRWWLEKDLGLEGVGILSKCHLHMVPLDEDGFLYCQYKNVFWEAFVNELSQQEATRSPESFYEDFCKTKTLQEITLGFEIKGGTGKPNLVTFVVMDKKLEQTPEDELADELFVMLVNCFVS